MVREAKYPWQDWLAPGQTVHVNVSDPKINTSIRFLQIQALNEAKRRGVRVRTTTCRQHGNCLVLAPRATERTDWSAFFKLVLEQQIAGRQHAVWTSELRTASPDSFVRAARRAAAQRGYTLRVDRRGNKDAIGFTVDVAQ